MKHYIVFLFLCFHGNIMRAELTNNLLEKSQRLPVGEGYLFKLPESCSTLLDSFADVASNITKCSIKYSSPVKLCEQCVEHYVNFADKYEELLTTVDNGTSCKSLYISHDRLDTVLEYHDSIMSVWNKGNCNACFDWNMTTPILSNATRHFNEMYNVTITCINDTMHNDPEQVCGKCMVYYLQLDDYYKSLSDDTIGVDSICMDVVDLMNGTRSIWSKTLNCCKLRRSPEIIFLACSGIISILPLLYYVAVRYCGPIRDLPNVLKQSRFKQMLLRRGNGSIN